MVIKYWLSDKVKVEIELRSKVTILTGNSGTGKTLLFNTVPSTLEDGTQVICFTKKSFTAGLSEAIRTTSNALFILDRFDLYKTPDIIDAINKDASNKFVIISRCWNGISYNDLTACNVIFDECEQVYKLQTIE